MKNIVLILSIFVLSILLVTVAYLLKNESLCCKYDLCKQLTTLCVDNQEEDPNEVLSAKGQTIILDNIKSGDTVDMGFEVEGSVVGDWFFEGVFPVRVINQEGEIMDSLSAEALEEWTTEEAVPFSFKIETDLDEESIVVLKFEKSNPSGLEENSDSAEITITLKPLKIYEEVETMKVKVFFSSSKLNPELVDCSLVFPVQREVEETVAVGRAALTELFKGTTEQEEDAGYFTNINEGVTIQSLTIKDGVAKVDLSSKLGEGVGGSCKVSAIRAQIEETLKQFSTVDSVVISIDGISEDILQP